MSERELDAVLNWFYIFGYFMVVGVAAINLMMVISLVVYLKTGIHVKDWLDEKFLK